MRNAPKIDIAERWYEEIGLWEASKDLLSPLLSAIHGTPEELSDLETPLDDACSTLELKKMQLESLLPGSPNLKAWRPRTSSDGSPRR